MKVCREHLVLDIKKMNVNQVRTSKTLSQFKRMSSMASTEFDKRDAFKETTRTIVMRPIPTDAKRVKVLIVSRNPFITDFLGGFGVSPWL